MKGLVKRNCLGLEVLNFLLVRLSFILDADLINFCCRICNVWDAFVSYVLNSSVLGTGGEHCYKCVTTGSS